MIDAWLQKKAIHAEGQASVAGGGSVNVVKLPELLRR
jgi:hypothetical protein